MTRRVSLWVSGCLFFAASVFTAATTLRLAWAQWLFQRGSYYLLAGLCLWFAVLLIRSRRFQFRSMLNRDVFFCLLVTIVIFVAVPPYFRVLPDESNLIAVSQSFFEDKTAQVVIMGQWIHQTFHPLMSMIPTRPLLFPFLVQLFHILSGYRPENALGFNFLVCFLLFTVLGRAFKKWLGSAAGYAAVMLCAAQPLFVMSATSGGFDLLAVFMTVVAFVYLFRFLLHPEEPLFRLLWIQLLLLCHVRYESPFLAAVIILGLALSRRIPPDYFSRSLIYPLTPLFVAPAVWQQFLNPESLHHGTGPLFGADLWLQHALMFFQTFWIFDGSLPYATLINWAGLAGLIWLGTQSFVNRQRYDVRVLTASWITAAAVLSYWILMTAFRWGNPQAATTWRLFTLFYLVLSCSAAAVFAKIPFLKRHPVTLFIAALGIFLCYLLQSAFNIDSHYSRRLILSTKLRETTAFLNKQNEPHALIIAPWPGIYTIFNRGAINFQYANAHKKEILEDLKTGRTSRIFVMQDAPKKTGKVFKNMELVSEYPLRTLSEVPFSDDVLLRISEVTSSSSSRERSDESRINP